MSVGQGAAKRPTTDDLQSNSSICVIDVAIGDWKFCFAIDVEPSTGALRDLAQTVAGVTGVDNASALKAVVAALGTAAVDDVIEAAA